MNYSTRCSSQEVIRSTSVWAAARDTAVRPRSRNGS